jgi:hypothetical protein
VTNYFTKEIPRSLHHWEGRKKAGDSHFLSGLMKAKEAFLMYGSFRLNNEKQIRFLEDKWLGNYSF